MPSLLLGLSIWVCNSRSMRQIPELTSTPPFSGKETAGRAVAVFRRARHFLNLPHTSDFVSAAERVPVKPRLNNGQNSQFRLHTKTPAGAKLLQPALVCLIVLFLARAEARFWVLIPPWAPRPARCGRVRRLRRWPCPCRSTYSRPGDRQRSRRPPAPRAPRTACRGPRSWRR